MAEVNEIFGKVTGEQSFFKPSAKKEFIPCAKGEYFGHIIEVVMLILVENLEANCGGF